MESRVPMLHFTLNNAEEIDNLTQKSKPADIVLEEIIHKFWPRTNKSFQTPSQCYF